MPTHTARHRDKHSLTQFSVFLENKVGRLNDLCTLLSQNEVHIIALCMVDNTDSAITRVVVDYADEARDVLKKYAFSFNEVSVFAVELESEANIRKVTSALAAAEVNIHYTYPLLMRPKGLCGLILYLEDNDIGIDILSKTGIKVLAVDDITR